MQVSTEVAIVRKASRVIVSPILAGASSFTHKCSLPFTPDSVLIRNGTNNMTNTNGFDMLQLKSDCTGPHAICSMPFTTAPGQIDLEWELGQDISNALITFGIYGEDGKTPAVASGVLVLHVNFLKYGRRALPQAPELTNDRRTGFQ